MPAYRCSNDGRLDSALTDSWGTTAAFASYIGVAGAYEESTKSFLDGSFTFEGGTRLIDVTDGLSQTLMVGERPPPNNLQAGWWYPSFLGATNHFVGPNNVMSFGNVVLWFGENDCAGARRGFFGPGALDNPCDRYHFWALHPAGGNWLFADGSVRFLAYSADPIMPALATRAGGEAVTLPD